MSFLKKIIKKFSSKNESAPSEETENKTPDQAPAKPRRNSSQGNPTRSNARRTKKKTNNRPNGPRQESSRNKPRPARKPKVKHDEQRLPTRKIDAVDPTGFKGFGFCPEILRAIGEEGYESPTPIQQAAIDDLLKGRDLLGCAQTGTGKTAAFALPTLELLARNSSNRTKGVKVLVLTPTRELALQVSESFKTYGRYLDISNAVVFGGVGIEPQKRALKRGVDVLVATPGRLLDLASQGFCDFRNLETLILDEADRMLDMGFLPDVKRIVKMLKPKRQNLLFSATMPDDIAKLSMSLLKDPKKVEVAPVSSTSDQVEQSLYYVEQTKKRDLLLEVLNDREATRVLVFTRTKAIANRIEKFLKGWKISAEAIHGSKSQGARQRALANFKSGTTRVLVASDLASRGLDVDVVTHVINFDLPNQPETYVHRIGRTGRAQAVGKAISFCDPREQSYVIAIEHTTQKDIPLVTGHQYEPTEEEMEEGRRLGPPPQGRGSSGHRPSRGRGGPRGAPNNRRPRPGGTTNRNSRPSKPGGRGKPKSKPGNKSRKPGSGKRG